MALPRPSKRTTWLHRRHSVKVCCAIVIAFGAVSARSGVWTERHADSDGTTASLRSQLRTRTTPDEAKPFLAEWTSVLEGPSAPITLTIVVNVADGKVIGTVSSDLFGETKVDEITNTEKGIALRFRCEVWGYSGVMVLNLVPDGDHLQLEFLIMNGQFNTSGVARKKPAFEAPDLRGTPR